MAWEICASGGGDWGCCVSTGQGGGDLDFSKGADGRLVLEKGVGICVGLLVLSLGIPKLAGSLRILHVSGYNVIETPRCCGMLSVTIA